MLKNNLKLILVILIICVLISGLSVYATYSYFAKDIVYKDGKNVEQALNELYEKNKLYLDFDFDNYPRSYPTDGSFYPTTYRMFVPNSYVVGLAANNYYSGTERIASFSFSKSEITLTNDDAEYGIAMPFVFQSGSRYKLSYISSNDKTVMSIMYYKRNGQFIKCIEYKDLDNGEFTVDNETYYTLIQFSVSGGGSTSVTDLQLSKMK